MPDPILPASTADPAGRTRRTILRRVGIAAVLLVWLALAGIADGWRRGDREILTAAWLLPAFGPALATFSNLNKTTAGNYSLQGNFSLTRFAGQTVRLQFRVITDAALNTTFRIDDVSVK